jgi:hypothetical protein
MGKAEPDKLDVASSRISVLNQINTPPQATKISAATMAELAKIPGLPWNEQLQTFVEVNAPELIDQSNIWSYFLGTSPDMMYFHGESPAILAFFGYTENPDNDPNSNPFFDNPEQVLDDSKLANEFNLAKVALMSELVQEWMIAFKNRYSNVKPKELEIYAKQTFNQDLPSMSQVMKDLIKRGVIKPNQRNEYRLLSRHLTEIFEKGMPSSIHFPFAYFSASGNSSNTLYQKSDDCVSILNNMHQRWWQKLIATSIMPNREAFDKMHQLYLEADKDAERHSQNWWNEGSKSIHRIGYLTHEKLEDFRSLCPLKAEACREYHNSFQMFLIQTFINIYRDRNNKQS